MSAPEDPLLSPLQFVTGVGPKRADLLAKLELHTVQDLLWYLPRDYLDLTDVRSVSQLEKDKVQQVIETIHERNIAFRTVYFNKIRVPSVPVGDVKLMSWKEPPEDWSCFSLGPQVALDRKFREWIKRRYPDPSPWEIEEL